MNIGIDSQVISKMVSEGFAMLLDGEVPNACSVFNAVNRIKPGNRPCSVGLSLADVMQTTKDPYALHALPDNADPMFSCLFSLILMQQGRANEAKSLLTAVSESDEKICAELARGIIQNEL